MLLQSDPSLAEVPGFSQEQLDRLARSVESRRQQLESDIQDYIRAKQHELRSYERQLVEQHRSMECVENTASAESNPATRADNPAVPHAARDHSSPDVERSESQERVKRTKHGKVKKREQELYGLVTPAFLPLLDARDSSPTSQKEKKSPKTERTEDTNVATGAEQTGASRHAEKSKERKPKKDHKEMEGVNAIDHARPTSQTESHKKTKRLSIKKSALRHKDTPRSRRKRVSLVIDGQTVLPADTVVEPPLTSPSSEATSTSNSTASLDELIDPRLTRPDFTHDAVHHSLPMPMANTHSPSKPLAETPSSLVIQADHSPPLTSPSIPFAPPSVATRTFLDPSPSQPNNQPPSIPRTAGPDPIYPNTASTEQLENSDLVANDESENENWGTYVGGLHGSGVDDVDQAGSYGYPSSLGASYLESYMQSRPLSVRMQAKDSRNGRDRPESEDEVGHGGRRYAEDSDDEEEDLVFGRNGGSGGGSAGVRRGEDEDMDITGSMEF